MKRETHTAIAPWTKSIVRGHQASGGTKKGQRGKAEKIGHEEYAGSSEPVVSRSAEWWCKQGDCARTHTHA